MLPNEHDENSYEQLFILFAKKIEKFLVRLVFVLFITLIFAQCLMQIPILRGYMNSVERMEGVPDHSSFLHPHV